MLFRSTTTKEGEIFFVDDKEIGLRELAMNVAIPTDPGQRTVKGTRTGNNCRYLAQETDVYLSMFFDTIISYCFQLTGFVLRVHLQLEAMPNKMLVRRNT